MGGGVSSHRVVLRTVIFQERYIVGKLILLIILEKKTISLEI